MNLICLLICKNIVFHVEKTVQVCLRTRHKSEGIRSQHWPVDSRFAENVHFEVLCPIVLPFHKPLSLLLSCKNITSVSEDLCLCSVSFSTFSLFPLRFHAWTDLAFLTTTGMICNCPFVLASLCSDDVTKTIFSRAFSYKGQLETIPPS